MTKKTRGLLIFLFLIGLLGAAAVFSFFANLYQKDMQALNGFEASYETYAKAFSDLKDHPTAAESAQSADQALANMQGKAVFRLSSLIKNEREAMSTAQEIGNLAADELAAFKAYQTAASAQSPDQVKLANELSDLSNRRQAAYAHFEGLGQ